MRPDDEWLPYLEGRSFSNSGSFRFPGSVGVAEGRAEVLQRLVAGRRVVHVGCVDHLPLLEQKLADGTWLHASLNSVAEALVGIDINKQGIEYLNRLGWTDTYWGDITEPATLPTNVECDVVVLGEVLEHIDDPVAFLTSIRLAWKLEKPEVVVTTPNAYALSALRSIRRQTETVNTDHRYWFTPYTAMKVAVVAGYAVEEIMLCSSTAPSSGSPGLPVRLKRGLFRQILQRSPLMHSTIVLRLVPRTDE